MHYTVRMLIVLFLVAGTSTSQALIMTRALTRAQAEQELGVVMKREYLGLGPVTNEAGISINFSRTGKLENFLYAELEVYSIFPTQTSNNVMVQRRLVSTTLQPTVDADGKVRAFFTVDPDYLDRTQVSIRVRARNSHDPDGYDIQLNAKDFPAPQPAQTQPVSHTANPIKIAQAKFTGGIGAIMMQDPNNKQFIVRQTVTNSPAAKAGLQANDIIVKIDGKPTAGRTLKRIVDDLRGFIGTSITLTIQRGGTNLDCIVHRTSWENLHVEPPPLLNNDKLPPGLPIR